jgi:MOSC domain-containing protein YiiM
MVIFPTPVINHNTGILRGIWISPTARTPLVSVVEVRAIPGRGLEGDRYFLECGSFSRWPGGGRAVSLIAEETLDAIRVEHCIDLREGRSRRNLVTSGITLADLHDRTFRIGTAVFRGIRPCPPCRHLEHLTEAGVFDALKDRGGFRADVIEEGVLHVGDAIELLPNS